MARSVALNHSPTPHAILGTLDTFELNRSREDVQHYDLSFYYGTPAPTGCRFTREVRKTFPGIFGGIY